MAWEQKDKNYVVASYVDTVNSYVCCVCTQGTENRGNRKQRKKDAWECRCVLARRRNNKHGICKVETNGF